MFTPVAASPTRWGWALDPALSLADNVAAARARFRWRHGREPGQAYARPELAALSREIEPDSGVLVGAIYFEQSA